MARRRTKTSQAWIELLADDPEATSALAVARGRLEAARHLTALRRLRVLELSGPLPDADEQARLLHRSIQFYNPHKERCTLRAHADDATPLGPTEHVVLVTDRGGARRPAAERWWLHETGVEIEVHEGTAWAMSFAASDAAAEDVQALTFVRDRSHGLFCNPLAQDAHVAYRDVPLPLIRKPARAKRGKTTA